MTETRPPKGTKFVALYNDGSGAGLFFRDDNGDYFDDGLDPSCDEALDDYLLWIPLPDDFKLWGEWVGSAE